MNVFNLWAQGFHLLLQNPGPQKVRCFFRPTFHAKWSKPIFDDFNGFPPDSCRLSIDFEINFLSFSISFSQFQSILIIFNQFQSVWLGQKRRNLLTTGRWWKQHLKKGLWRGLWRVFEGSSYLSAKGPRAFKTPSKRLQEPFESLSRSDQNRWWATPPVRLGLSGGNSGKIPERPRKHSQSVSWNFPWEYGWDAPNPIIQGIWGFQSVSRILSPPVRLGTPLFSELVPERASQSWSWNSQQYWGYFWDDALGLSGLKNSVPGSLVTRPKTPPRYRETGAAIHLSRCVSCSIADNRCYAPTSFCNKKAYRNPKTDLTRGASQKKPASEACRAIEGVARNSITNRAIVGHTGVL